MYNSSSFDQSDIITHSSDIHYWHIWCQGRKGFISLQFSTGEEFGLYGIRYFSKADSVTLPLKSLFKYSIPEHWMETWYFDVCLYQNLVLDLMFEVGELSSENSGKPILWWWERKFGILMSTPWHDFCETYIEGSHFLRIVGSRFENWREQKLSIPCGSALITFNFSFQASQISKSIKT